MWQRQRQQEQRQQEQRQRYPLQQQQQQQQQQPYGANTLLNDLHSYFPDLLYNGERFLTVQDILKYIREEAENRYNIYNRERRQHVAVRVAARAHVPLRRESTRGAARSHAAVPTQFYPTVHTPLIDPFITSDFSFTTLLQQPQPQQQQPAPSHADIDSATALLALLGLATLPLPQLQQQNQLFAPVIVRPSQDIIQRTTTQSTITAPPPPDGICVICQDEFEMGSIVRTIRHCGHIFHNICIQQHFENSVRCPTCRHDIRESASEGMAL